MKKKSHILLYLIVLLAMVIFIGTTAIAATYYTFTNGNPATLTLWWTGTNGTGTHPANFTTAGDIFIIQTGDVMTLAATWTVTGTVQITSGGTLTATAANVTLGALTIDGGGTLTCSRILRVNGPTDITGTITLSGARANVFTGDVTLYSGASWTNTTTSAQTFSGNFTNDASTFSSTGNGVYTFNGANKTFSGSMSTVIPNVAVTGTYTNNGTLTVGTALTGAGGLTNGATGVLNIGGTSGITTLTATTAGNTVNYTGAAQTVKTGTYVNLGLSGTGAKTTATVTVNGIFTVGGNAAVTVSAVPTYGAAATLQYNKTAAFTSSVEWPAAFSGTGGVIIGGTGTITTNAAKTLNAGVPLTINAGATLATGANNAWTLTVGGTTSVSGTLTLANTATKTFTGDVTINSGGVWNETGAAAINYAGSLQNDGATFTAITGVHTFSGATEIMSGATAISIPTATFTGNYTNSGTLTCATALTITGAAVVLTNNGTITASTALSGTGILTNSATGVLNIGGTCSITTLTNAGTTAITGAGAISTALANFTNTGTLNLGGSGTIAGITNNDGGIVNLSNSGTITSFNNATSTSTLNISDLTISTISTLTVTTSGNTVNYNGAGTQTIIDVAYSNLTTSGSGTKTWTETADRNMTGNLTIGDGTTLSVAGAFAFTVTGTTTIGSGTSGTLSITNATGTKTFTGTVTINSGASLNVTVAATLAFGSDIADNGTLSFGSGILNISGNLTGTGTVTGGTGSINISGDWTQNGTFTASTSTVNYNGSSANEIVRGGITYYNLQISNGTTKLLQVGNATVSNALTLTSGTITTNAYSIVVSTGTVSRTSGYVIGNLNLYFAIGATSHTFDIGGVSAYTPVTVSFTGVTTAGSLTATTTTGDHPQILTSGLNNSKTANRYWTLTNSGIVFTTYDVVFTFVPADLDGSAVPTSFSVGRYNGGTWSTPTLGTRTATTTQALAIAAFGDFQLGNIQSSGVSNYTPTRTTGISYTSIATTGNAVESWRTSNISDNSYYDDNRSFPVPIGFDFWYDGSRYTQFSVSTNGFMDFDASSWNGGSGSVQPNNPYGPYSTDFVNPTRSAPSGGVGTVTTIAPFYFDLTTWQTTVPLGNSIKYQLDNTAPNRVLTIEWINMSCWVHTEDVLNFQVKLYESTGVIEFYYGNMSGTIELEAGFGYATGINAPSISPNPPTAAQLLCLQMANTNTFSNTQQYQLLAMPQINSKYTFTPNIPVPPTSLSFSNVTSYSMRLSWNDVADNELGYVIYRSDNGGASYSFIRQLTAGSSYSDETGLIANTTYYWKVYAITEGGLSSALSGSHATLPAVGFTSAQTGNWNTATTWVEGAVPSPNADVTIANGHIVTLDVNASLNSLTIGQGSSGTLHIGNDITARTLTVSGDLTIKNGATLDVNTAFTQTGHAVILSGNLINNGILNLGPNASSAAGITFNKPSGTQTISGTGTATNFYAINVNVGTTSSDILEVTSNNFSSLSGGFLTLTNGTFKVSTGATITPFSGSQTISSSAGLWINHSSAVVSTTGGDLSVAGILHSTAGTLNIGNAADNRLVYSGGMINIEGGTINVAGRIERSNLTTIIKFNMSGGVLTVPTVGSTSTTVSPIELTVVGSTFTWTNGSIIVQREGGSGAQDLGYVNTLTNFTVIGGTLQIGNSSTPAAQRMNISSTPYLNNILVNNANATAIVVGNVTILGNMTVASGALETTLNGLANFNGTAPQNITTVTPISFNNLTLNNGTGLSVSGSITVTCTLTLTNGAFSIGANTLTFQTSNTPIAKTSGTITTTTSSNLVFGTSGNTGGAAFTIPAGTFTAPPSINNFTINRTNSLTLNDQMMSLSGILLCNGPLTTNGNLTLLSTAAQTALIDGSSTGQVSGNMTMQRYLPSGFGYKYVSSPFQSATVNEFSNDLDLGASFPTFYKYDENKTSSGWVNYTTTTNPLTPMQGYSANFGSTATAKTVDVTGVVNNGILSITLHNDNQPYTVGFNLVGNPYPSPINWNAASGWTKTNIDNALYYFQAGSTDQYTGTYSTYINGISSDGLATNIIPSMQGFFVHVSNGTFPVTGTLGITNSVRTNDLTHAFLKTIKTDTLPLLRVIAGFADDGTPSDPAAIYFDSSATQLFDKNLDALKIMNTDVLVPNVYAMTPDSQRLSISAIPIPVDSIRWIPLGIKTAKDGWITFKASDIKLMPTDRYIYIVDSVAGINQDLKLNPQYRIFLKAGEYENRFSLAFSLTVLNNIPKEFSLLQNYPNPFNPRTTIKYLIPQTSFVTITVYDILGKEVSKLVNEEKLSGSYEVQFDGSKLSSGVYFYRLHVGSFFKTKKIMLLK